MKKIGGWVVWGSAAMVLLSACGGRSDPATGGGAGSSVSSSRVALGNKTDALRELGIVASLAGQVAGGATGFDSGLSDARRVRPWDHGKGSGGQVTAKESQQGACPGGGSYSAEDDIDVSRSFALFSGASATVNLSKGSNADCRTVWSQKDGASDAVTLRGAYEAGSSASGYSYGVQGSGSEDYVELHEKKNGSGRVVETRKLQFRGLAEVREQEGQRDVRASFAYRYDPADGNFFSSIVGDTTTPFKLVQGSTLALSGPYSYSSKQCSGGQGVVTTEDPVGFDDKLGLPNAGRLKIAAGDKVATFTFQAGGTATLQVGDSSQSISADELRAALNPANPC